MTSNTKNKKYRFFNEDCISGCEKHIENDSVDLIITDPPYGIGGDKLDKHYNRDESHVIDGYVEVPSSIYPQFSEGWIKQAERILKPGGSIYIVSGYTNLVHILNALGKTRLEEKNHLIWKYNFGVYTKTKYISSHYHILFYTKRGKRHTFNTFSRYADHEKSDQGGSSNYSDREDVWLINREYKPGKIKNKNELPTQLLIKLIQYSSNQGDLICDFFLGSFSTAKVAKGLNREVVGFELNKGAFEHQIREFDSLDEGYLLDQLRKPPENQFVNSGKPISEYDQEQISKSHIIHLNRGMSKAQSIETLSEKFGRGYWSILRIIDRSVNVNVANVFDSQVEMKISE
ncbi:MAG: site-specific DNA-methyltransferase [Gammaproteobacteria bacterium]|nr:site-specific DNA-methyltransferase [Gammaproteobacteria bacterium]